MNLRPALHCTNLDIEAARGIEGVKIFSGCERTTLNLAVANGLGNARKVLDKVAAAKQNGDPVHATIC